MSNANLQHDFRHTSATTERRPTSVSRVLRAITDEMPPAENVWDVRSAEGVSRFKIKVASDHATRVKAYSLAYRIYQRCGYIGENPAGVCVSPYDAFAGTITLLAEDMNGRAVGTISLVFDSTLGLPCDEIYKPELELLRTKSRSLVEVTRLALEDDIEDARTLLLYMFSMVYIFARHVAGCTDLLIEVTPRHGVYYQRMLRFHQVGGVRPCPRVKGTPGVLLRMDCAEMDALVSKNRAGRDANGKRMHPYPFTPEQQSQAADFLARNHRSMTFKELCSFKIFETELQPMARD